MLPRPNLRKFTSVAKTASIHAETIVPLVFTVSVTCYECSENMSGLKRNPDRIDQNSLVRNQVRNWIRAQNQLFQVWLPYCGSLNRKDGGLGTTLGALTWQPFQGQRGNVQQLRRIFSTIGLQNHRDVMCVVLDLQQQRDTGVCGKLHPLATRMPLVTVLKLTPGFCKRSYH